MLDTRDREKDREKEGGKRFWRWQNGERKKERK